MKTFDYILRNWRYHVVKPYVPESCRILDIGGFDGSFLMKVYSRIEKGVCIDPFIEEINDKKLEFIKYRISNKIPFASSSFDVVTMLAVFEHMSSFREPITSEISRILTDNGLVVLTIPSTAVDHILKVLLKMRLIDGMSLEEHDHLEAEKVIKIFQKHGFLMKHWKKFQFGLNNLFVFKKQQASSL